MLTKEAVKQIWRSADAVCFDVDSTVIEDEAIDEMAEFCGVGEQVAAWTKKAMGGSVSFREALQERLKIINATEKQVQDFVENNPPKFTKGIETLIKLLQRRGVPVYLVSGGFKQVILPAARLLKIPADRVFANVLLFEDGKYAGFDKEQPTSESGGKGRVISILKKKYGYQKLVMIGDGATDMEACPPGDAFIGFGGNQIRQKVQLEAKWFVTDFNELISELSR
ncbi:phosphoserine phosphatase isoform X4 [Lingula anatina]|nr:phosphoserine phosphatase isoform X3 [Lingula anatina]XP_013381751.1 phosphoserine phosphatase isoform X4 [Lingula anatina]XP_013381752.1 phosphoserine phosphatase isoform X4 [Lingula anatina]XP_013381754.1 phosphoserine phosphatase isoform X4 [Lingula anatina]|eukprot:XP_013381750.1 phosphoserine phosphatase isoform X3 [Lingula anatina]